MERYHFENQYRVQNIMRRCKDMEISLSVPGSKSITNRALLLSALADGTSCLKGALFSDDSRYFLQGLKDMGFEVEADEDAREIFVTGLAGKLPQPEGRVYVGSAGTAARFLTAMLAFSGEKYELDASPQMRKRPMKSLLDALKSLGVEVTYQEEEGHFPFVLKSKQRENLISTNEGQEKTTNEIKIDVEISSQFLSALLMAGVMLPEGLRIHLTGHRKSLPYVEMTARMMEQFHVCPHQEARNVWVVPGKLSGSCYQASTYEIEPDVSTACYFYAMALILGIAVQVKGVHLKSLQGDIRFLEVLESLGCRIDDDTEGIRVTGTKKGYYPGLAVNMNEFSDQTMTMAAIAVFAQSPTRIEGVGHIRYQESNRIEAICTELGRLGIRCEEQEDGFVIYPGPVHPAVLKTYEDHRMAMAFSLIGLRVDGIVIDNPGCCAKTFEGYFALLDKITEMVVNR